jgi:hypothetical protein
MVCLLAHDQLKQIRSVISPCSSMTYFGASGEETEPRELSIDTVFEDAAATGMA